MFTILSKVAGQADQTFTMSKDGAANFIEGWASKFSGREPTAYGFKKTVEFLNGLVADEVHEMMNRDRSGARFKLIVSLA